MKKGVIIGMLLIIILPVWLSVYKKQQAINMMTGGFGTQYADSPHPFGNPHAKVRCHKIYRDVGPRDIITLPIHQGQTLLHIPRDGIREVNRRSDSDTCVPVTIKLIYAWHNNKLLRATTNNSEANDGNDTGTTIYPSVTVTLSGLQNIDDSTETEQEPSRYPESRFAEDKRYVPAYRHNYLPLWYYPNLHYENYPTDTDGFGIANTINPETNHPFRVHCYLDTSNLGGSGAHVSSLSRDEFVNIELSKSGGSRCETWKNISILGHDVRATIEIEPQDVPDMDTIFDSIDAVIQDYATPATAVQPNQNQ